MAAISISAGALLGAILIGRATTASAANMIAINPASGGSATGFNITTPGGAACALATNKQGGDKIDSYVVDNSMVPVAQLANMAFTGSPPLPANSTGYVGAVLKTPGHTNYVNIATLPDTGQPAALPTFSWQGYASLHDFGANAASGDDLYPGTFNIGIACVTPAGKVDGNDFWNLQVKFTASTTDSGGFTWALAPFATSVTLKVSPAGSDLPGAAVTLTATVSPATAPGTVTFNDGDPTALGTESVVVNAGVATATFVTGSLKLGSHSLSATYNPEPYNSVGLQAIDAYASSKSATVTYVISTTATTSPTTTASGTGSGSTDTGTGSTGSATGSSGAAPSGSGGTGSDSTSGTGSAGGSSASGSSDPTLAATGAPLTEEIFLAVISVFGGLFALSFGIPTIGRARPAIVDRSLSK
jgi:hypothetical protein